MEYALPEQHFSKATERTPAGATQAQPPGLGVNRLSPGVLTFQWGYGPPKITVVEAREVPGVETGAETKTSTGKSKGKRPLGPLGRVGRKRRVLPE